MWRGLRKTRSGDVARKRLTLLLAADKTECSVELIERLKRDLCQVISRYMEIDTEDLELKVHKITVHGKTDKIPALYADIPIRKLSYKGTF